MYQYFIYIFYMCIFIKGFKSKLISLFLLLYRYSYRQTMCHIFRRSCSKITCSPQSHFTDIDGSFLPSVLYSTLKGESYFPRSINSGIKPHIIKASSRKHCVSIDHFFHWLFKFFMMRVDPKSGHVNYNISPFLLLNWKIPQTSVFFL